MGQELSSQREHGFLKRALSQRWWFCFALSLANLLLFALLSRELYDLWAFSDWSTHVELSEDLAKSARANSRRVFGGALALFATLGSFPLLFCLCYRFVEKGRS